MTTHAQKHELTDVIRIGWCLPFAMFLTLCVFVPSTLSDEPGRSSLQDEFPELAAAKPTGRPSRSSKRGSTDVQPASVTAQEEIDSPSPEALPAEVSDLEFFGNESASSEWVYDDGRCPDCNANSHFCRTGNDYDSGLLSRCTMWVRPELGLWWLQGFSVPPLVTTSPFSTDRTLAGRLDQTDTTILYGGDLIANTVRAGGRIRVGLWFDPCQTRGLDISYMGLASGDDKFNASSDANPILARPFQNVEPSFVGPDTELVAFPGMLSGSIQTQNQTSFEVLDVLYRYKTSHNRGESLDFLFGWRFSRLNDRLSIQDSKTSLDGASGIALGTTIQEQDRFNARNLFNGMEVGLIRENYCGCWSWEFMGKMAVGRTNVRTSIDGQTTVAVPINGGLADVSVTPSGLLAQQSNIGVTDSHFFTVIPEARLGLGYCFTDRFRATLGYTFMYWPGVARSGNLIDSQLNLSQLTPGGLTGAARPTNLPAGSGMWAQGINIGFNYQF